ncbi:thiamine pyrophosphate-dependent enzyme [Limisalsivibrio acetivorans]|uniref:thiamine pyrophosphate-dependent enzyme n=1 Tax=Limisalsivibrio acetivorans TaxID=1304888 RepID=UPI0003B65851|nr:thiamine pyrophosphate-dependent enzyme [Limisalsivibrio acetivorans]
MKPLDYNTGVVPSWCPGCGNFAIWNSIKKALSESDRQPYQTALVSGIGCSGKMSNHVKAYTLHGLHGRTLPVATGIKLANPEMTVLVNGGDGDGYGMGVGHFVHAMRRNVDLTYIVHNNRVYGLTTGQASPTNKEGVVTKSTPFGVVDGEMNPLALALVSGATFVARSFSADSDQMAELIQQAMDHKGFAYIDVLQPCVTFGGKFQYDYYHEKVYHIDEKHDTSDMGAAMKLVSESEKLPLGLFYKEEKDDYNSRHPEIAKAKVEKRDVRDLLNSHR